MSTTDLVLLTPNLSPSCPKCSSQCISQTTQALCFLKKQTWQCEGKKFLALIPYLFKCSSCVHCLEGDRNGWKNENHIGKVVQVMWKFHSDFKLVDWMIAVNSLTWGIHYEENPQLTASQINYCYYFASAQGEYRWTAKNQHKVFV